MTDVWARFNELDAAMQERLAGVLETRGRDAQQQSMRREFLTDICFPAGAEVLEVGCGTGVLTRVLAGLPGVETVVGTDPAPALLERARELATNSDRVSFQQADGRCLPFDAETFDVVVLDSVLSHMPGPEAALAEAFRVLRPDGVVAVFDGDYATTTVALGDHDPLQVCVDMMMANTVNDRWLIRRLPGMARGAGFVELRPRSYGFVDTGGGYMLTVLERGIDMLLGTCQIGTETAQALKAEAHRRVDSGAFFGHIAYGSLIARKGTDHSTGRRLER
jgi:ubiquinone/menaquinone biosynthesis C-methylase UbiE